MNHPQKIKTVYDVTFVVALVQFCGTPQPVTGATYSPSGQSQYALNTQVTYTCVSGQTVAGTITCISTGWSGDPGTCDGSIIYFQPNTETIFKISTFYQLLLLFSDRFCIGTSISFQAALAHSLSLSKCKHQSRSTKSSNRITEGNVQVGLIFIDSSIIPSKYP